MSSLAEIRRSKHQRYNAPSVVSSSAVGRYGRRLTVELERLLRVETTPRPAAGVFEFTATMSLDIRPGPVAAGPTVARPEYFVTRDEPRHKPERPAAFAKWFDRLRAMIALQDGWNSYSAPKPSPEAIANARTYLAVLNALGWEPSRVDPSAMGGVGVTHRRGKRKVYLEFYNDGTAHALLMDGTNDIPDMHTKPVRATAGTFVRFIKEGQEYLNG